MVFEHLPGGTLEDRFTAGKPLDDTSTEAVAAGTPLSGRTSRRGPWRGWMVARSRPLRMWPMTVGAEAMLIRNGIFAA